MNTLQEMFVYYAQNSEYVLDQFFRHFFIP